jgi:hypothetical protein
MADELRRCAICGKQVRRDAHHLGGRGHDEEYLDPATADLCHDDHELAHDDLRRQRIDAPLESGNVLERVERLLRRVGVFLARVAEGTGISWCVGLAAACVRMATDLRHAITALDRWNIHWREAI